MVDKMKNIIIVVNYNDFETCLHYINQVKGYKQLDKIIVVDNCSTDDSAKNLKEIKLDKLDLIVNDKNKGYAYGNNIGIKYAIKNCGKCNLIISNPDIDITEKVFDNLISIINKPEIDMLAPIINEHGCLNYGWRLTNSFDEMMISLPGVGKKYREYFIKNKVKKGTEGLLKSDVLSGCFFLVKSDVMKNIDYFDENTFLYYEENILATKIKKYEYNAYVSLDNIIYHNHSVSVDKSVNELNRYKLLKQSQKYYLDNYLKSNFIIDVIIRICNKLMIKHYKK